MELKRETKSAMITIELAISLVLVVVVLFVTLGLFSNNLKDMFAAGNFKNIFNGEGIRTFFASFNRNYSNSQVDVQLLGEQGLEVIRKKANNSDLNLIDNATSNGKSSTATVSKGSASTILYLSQVINIIVGNGTICKQMPKESVAYCGKEGVPESQYALTISGNNKLSVQNLETGNLLTLNTQGFKNIQSDSNGSNSMSAADKIKAIKALTDAYGSSVNSGYASEVARDVNYYSSQITTLLTNNSGTNNDQIEDEIAELYNSLLASFKKDHKDCSGFLGIRVGSKECYPCITNNDIDHFKDAWKDYAKELETYVTNSNQIVQASSSSGASPTNTVSALPTDSYNLYKPSNSWFKTSTKQYVAGSEDALEIARPTNSSLQKFAKNSTQTTSALANEYRQLRYAMGDDGGGGGGTSGGGGGGGSTTNTPQTGGDYNVNAIPTVKVSQYTLSCESTGSYTCTSSNVVAKAQDVSGQTTSMTFAQSYINSPLGSDRINKAKSYSSRVAVMEQYNNMVEAIWNGDKSPSAAKMESFIIQDQKENSCAIFKNGLTKIAKKHGLVSMQNAIQNGTNYCRVADPGSGS